MTGRNTKTQEILDKAIIVFVIIFIASLNNSIFINQIGYFGALLLMLISMAISRENRFEKTGLEVAFLLFLGAEVLSTIFSVNPALAGRNLFKRAILIPIVYTVFSAADDPQRAKLFFKVYIVAASLTIGAYIVFAYEHFITQLYQLEAKGPSPFQYVMTAGGLISFTTIYLFAFLVNEKTSLKIKLLNIAAFIMAGLALVASYTRAAWMGAAAGIFLIIILKRKWYMAVAIVLIIAAAFVLIKNESKVYTYKISQGKLNQVSVLNTGGKASGMYVDSATKIIADYEDGLLLLNQGKIVNKIETPSPVVTIDRWTGNYFFAVTVDFRFLIFRRTEKNQLKFEDEFVSPGQTVSYVTANNNVYIADLDSGVTVYTNPRNPNEYYRYPEVEHVNYIAADSNYFASYSYKYHALSVFNMKAGFPGKLFKTIDIKTTRGFIWLKGNRLFISENNGLGLFNLAGGEAEDFALFKKLENTINLQTAGDTLIATTILGKIYKAELTRDTNLTVSEKFSLGFAPKQSYYLNGTIYVVFNKRNRISSMVDIYHPSNIQRLDQWKTGLRIFKKYPLFGVGDIDMKPVYAKFKRYYEKENFGHLHNIYVHLLVALGLVGFLAAMYMLLKVFLTHVKIYKSLSGIPVAASFALGTLAAFIGFLVSGLAEFNFGDQEIITVVWFTLGLNLAFMKYFAGSKNENN